MDEIISDVKMNLELKKGEPKIHDKSTTNKSWTWGLKESRILPGFCSNGEQKKASW